MWWHWGKKNKKHSVRVLENRVLRGVFWPEEKENTGAQTIAQYEVRHKKRD
jgi:hypothetical protein